MLCFEDDAQHKALNTEKACGKQSALAYTCNLAGRKASVVVLCYSAQTSLDDGLTSVGELSTGELTTRHFGLQIYSHRLW